MSEHGNGFAFPGPQSQSWAHASPEYGLGGDAAGEPGSEPLAPLAVVVLGGLFSSTLLNLVVVPASYALVFGAKR